MPANKFERRHYIINANKYISERMLYNKCQQINLREDTI